MGTLRGYLFLLMAFVVKASEEHMLQKEISLIDVMAQSKVSPEPPDKQWMGETGFSHRQKVGPRSMGPHIPFPPAHPTHSNLQAICSHGNHRPRYPKDVLPTSGFGYLYRQAQAINQLESWFTECCSSVTEDKQLTLCCVQQAWEESLSAFCNEEFTIKTKQYHCCMKEAGARWECFKKNAPDQSYQASDHKSWTNIPSQTFNFNPGTCQKTRSEVTHSALREKGTPDISFPLGRPNSANIGSICANRKQRPRYLSKCLPSSDYDWLARQSKAINGLEKGFSQCCKEKKDEQACAEKKWKKMVDMFCKEEKAAKAKHFDCCKKERGEEQYDCFAAAAPNPDYILEDASGAASQAHPTLEVLCVSENSPETQFTQRALQFPESLFVPHCCHLVEENRSACFERELNKFESNLCKDDQNSMPCCMKKAESRNKCFTKQLLRNIPDLNRISRNKKCPISS
ncbi:hypothetical protein P4O66_010332 [Electrophorus voltai]|uniref:Extracellular matrix protein 1b n=1 Tax=Electrophorus voltai TaxID=2609070 RepID=A0AAD9DWB0_9TELE|nr:hypothetical protein P4O66_010332 [Electrophorus voltai]